MDADKTFFKIPREIAKTAVDFLVDTAQEELLGDTIISRGDAQKPLNNQTQESKNVYQELLLIGEEIETCRLRNC